jgi:hypothetical protein
MCYSQKSTHGTYMLASNVFLKKISEDKIILMSLEREEIVTVTGKLAHFVMALNQGLAVRELSLSMDLSQSLIDKVHDTFAALGFLEDGSVVTSIDFTPEGFADAGAGELLIEKVEHLAFSSTDTKNEETW